MGVWTCHFNKNIEFYLKYGSREGPGWVQGGKKYSQPVGCAYIRE